VGASFGEAFVGPILKEPSVVVSTGGLAISAFNFCESSKRR
jgi:hypothetical protein